MSIFFKALTDRKTVFATLMHFFVFAYVTLMLSLIAAGSHAPAQEGAHQIKVEKGDFGERTTTIYPDGASKIVTKDSTNHITEEHRRKDGTRYYEKNSFFDGGYREDFYDATGKEETASQLFRKDGTLNWCASVLPSGARNSVSYFPDGKTIKFQSTTFNMDMRTAMRYRKDGKTPWWFKTDVNDEQQVKVFFDTKGNPTERQFWIIEIAKSGFSLSQGDGPKEYCRHLYRDKSLTALYQQTWSLIWPADAEDSVPTLTTLEVFTADGKRVERKLIFEPTEKGTPVLKHCFVYRPDGSYIKRSFDEKGKRIKEVDCRADGKELSTRTYGASDRHEEPLDKKWFEGFATPGVESVVPAAISNPNRIFRV